jgi:hypothetical protein
MADTATTVNEITTHFFGDMMARDLGFSDNTNCYGALAFIPRAMDSRGALALDDALDQVADASTPRATVDLPFFTVDDEMKPPHTYGGAFKWPTSRQQTHICHRRSTPQSRMEASHRILLCIKRRL